MDDNRDMGFWEHFDALRGVLLCGGVVLGALLVIYFIFMNEIFDAVILAPCRADFPLYTIFDNFAPEGEGSDAPFHVELINIKLAAQLFVHLSLAFHLALITAFPILLWLLWRFVKPGLYERERRGATRAFLAGNAMFYAGVAVGYFVVFPVTLRFLATYQLSEAVPNVISLDSYIDNFTMIILVMGIVFELPVLGWLLGRMGLLRRRFFSKYRRHAIVVLLIAAALITPTGDPVTLFIVFLPLYILFEMTAWLVPADK